MESRFVMDKAGCYASHGNSHSHGALLPASWTAFTQPIASEFLGAHPHLLAAAQYRPSRPWVPTKWVGAALVAAASPGAYCHGQRCSTRDLLSHSWRGRSQLPWLLRSRLSLLCKHKKMHSKNPPVFSISCCAFSRLKHQENAGSCRTLAGSLACKPSSSGSHIPPFLVWSQFRATNPDGLAFIQEPCSSWSNSLRYTTSQVNWLLPNEVVTRDFRWSLTPIYHTYVKLKSCSRSKNICERQLWLLLSGTWQQHQIVTRGGRPASATCTTKYFILHCPSQPVTCRTTKQSALVSALAVKAAHLPKAMPLSTRKALRFLSVFPVANSNIDLWCHCNQGLTSASIKAP